jgi:hypothetical protein
MQDKQARASIDRISERFTDLQKQYWNIIAMFGELYAYLDVERKHAESKLVKKAKGAQ